MTRKVTKSGLPDRRGTDKAKHLPNVRFQALEQDDSKRDVIAKTINNVLAISHAFADPVQSDEELCERLEFFFRNCSETRQLATVEKMCLSLGMTKESVFDIIEGKNKGFSRETSQILKKAKDFIAAIDAELALEGRIAPVVYIFRGKNYHGMRDQQEVVLTPNNTLNDYQDMATIEAKYAELPED